MFSCLHNQKAPLTFESRRAPTNGIRIEPLPLHIIRHLPKSNPLLITTRILRENILELLRHEAPFRVVSTGVRAVLVFVDVRDVDAKERIGKDGGRGRVGEVGVDDYEGEEGDWGKLAEGN